MLRCLIDTEKRSREQLIWTIRVEKVRDAKASQEVLMSMDGTKMSVEVTCKESRDVADTCVLILRGHDGEQLRTPLDLTRKMGNLVIPDGDSQCLRSHRKCV